MLSVENQSNVHTDEPLTGAAAAAHAELARSQAVVDGFFAGIGPWTACYGRRMLAFFGVLRGQEVLICRARVRLTVSGADRRWVFRTKSFVAGMVSLSGSTDEPQRLVRRILAGESVEALDGLRLRLATDDRAGIYIEPPQHLHEEGLQTGRRLSVLVVAGGMLPPSISQPDLDWELKAAREPFDSIGDLLSHLGLGPRLGQRSTIEVVAGTPVEVLHDSGVDGSAAKLGLWLPAPLVRADARLGYRVLSKGGVIDRGTLDATQLTWTVEGSINVGRARITVPPAAIVNSIAVYADQAHHSYWFGDPRASQNPRIAVFDAIDPGLELLRAYLLPASLKSGVQHQFEAAVAWVLWAYGLSVVQTDRADQAKDGPDVVAVAPAGGHVIVECTTGLLKAENKLAKLCRRVITIRDRLAAAGLSQIPVLPVLVTSLPRTEVAAELDAAAESAVLVLTRENLVAALNEIQLYPDGDRVFARGQEALRVAVEELAQRRRTDDS